MPVAVPLISAGIGAAGSIYNGYKQRKQQQQQQRQQQPLINAQTQLGYEAANTGRQLTATGMGALNQSVGYYDKLLRGDRSQLLEATAPERAQVTDLYRGAERNLDRSAPGGTRDVQRAELNRERVGRLGGLVQGVRGGAAAAMGQLGQFALQQGNPANAAGIFSNILAGTNAQAQLALRERMYGDEQSEALWKNIGQLFTQGYGAWQNRKGSYSTAGGFASSPA